MSEEYPQIRIIVAGSRDINDYEFVKKTLKAILKQFTEKDMVPMDERVRDCVTIVSGGARGVDKLGEKFAKQYKLKLKIFPADWNKFGKGAGMIRNKEMADYAIGENGFLMAFWDGKSKGTKGMIDIAQKMGLTVFIVRKEE